MNPRHPVPDICDLHARADLFGLGLGLYPKAKAPRPPFHPFCWCKLVTRPDVLAAAAKEREDGARAFLRSLPPDQAARVLGSRERLARVMNGADWEAVAQAGVPAQYRLVRLGQDAASAATDNAGMSDAYEIAKTGGDGSGFLKQLSKMGSNQLRRSMASLDDQAAAHRGKISDPLAYVPDWEDRTPEYRAGLLAKWRKEIENFTMQANIIKGYIHDQRN